MTKDFHFRAYQEFHHDVGIVIEVYKKAKARQFRRFNEGSETGIFEDDS